MKHPHDDDGDGLNICAVCGDRYTQQKVCHVCRQQQMIDDDPMDGYYIAYQDEDWDAEIPNNPEHWDTED